MLLPAKLCFGPCTKEVYDAKNARITPPVVKDQEHCPDLTPAEQTQIANAVNAAAKQETIVSPPCKSGGTATDPQPCTCGNWGPQPPFGNYTPVDFECVFVKSATFGDPPKAHQCKYTIKGKVDIAKVTVTGSCMPATGFVLKVNIP